MAKWGKGRYMFPVVIVFDGNINVRRKPSALRHLLTNKSRQISRIILLNCFCQ